MDLLGEGLIRGCPTTPFPSLERLYYNYCLSPICHFDLITFCHFEPFDKLPETTLGTGRTGSAKRGIVILSPALGGTKDLKIPRLSPRNVITTQPLTA
jgi:hypothetical protein